MVRGFVRPVVFASLLVSGLAWAQQSRLVSDTFNGANGSRPQGWTVPADPGPTYWTLSDNRVMSGDQAKIGKSSPLLLLSTAPGSDRWADYHSNADFVFLGSSGGVVQVLRYRDDQNFYEVGVFAEGINRFAKIDKVTRGVRKTLARVENSSSSPIPTLDGTGSTWDAKRQVIRGIVAGNEIGLQVGNAPNVFRMAAYDPDPITAGTCGLGVVGGSAIFDNAVVKTDTENVFVKGSSGGPAGGAVPGSASVSTAPTAAQGSGNFVVQVASGLTRDRADTLARTLVSDGYPDARVVSAGADFSVVVGTNMSRERADQLFQTLRADYTPEAVVSADAPSPQATPAVVAAAPAASQTGGRAVLYRVQVFDDFPEVAQANAVREELIRDDYANVEVQAHQGRFRVVMGSLPTRADAEQLVADLLKNNYPKASVIELAEAAPAAAAPTNDLSDIESMPGFANLSEDQKRTLRDIVSRTRAAEAGNVSARDLLALREETKGLKEDLRLMIQANQRSEEERREKEGRVRDLYREIDQAMGLGNIPEAEKLLQQARIVYPDYPGHQFKEQRIRELKGGTSPPAQSAAATPAASATLSAADQQQVDTLLADARQAKVERRNADALAKYRQVLALDPSNREAGDEVRALPALVSTDRLGAQGLQPGFQTYLFYIGIALVIVTLGVFGFVLVQNIRRERELIKQVSQMQEFVANQSSGRFPVIGSNPNYPVVTGTTPGLTPEQFAALQQGGGGLAGMGSGLSAPVNMPMAGSGLSSPVQSSLSPALGQVSPAPVQAMPESPVPGFTGTESSTTIPLPFPGPPPARGPLTDEVRLSPIAPRGEGVAPAPAPPAAPSAPVPATFELPPPPVAEDVFAIPGFSPTALPEIPEIPTPSEKAPSSGVGFALPELPQVPAANPPSSRGGGDGIAFNDLQTVFIAPGAPESGGNLFPPVPEIPPVPQPLPAQPTPSGFDSAIRGITPVPPIAPIQDSSSLLIHSDLSKGVIFSQMFDDETADDQPMGWAGDYDYAALTIDRAIAATEGGHSLKFEKRTGAGSANYVCKFPKASGLVRVEFDIRCDDKNKYLLGFYIEKDEDFKQSIHTIVHRMDSKSTPSLRVQGEPVPYEFGTWRHMTYELNLPAGLVTAYVDGEQVIKDARLPTAPNYVNTLSIRDNLATTGVLYLDNILVSKM